MTAQIISLADYRQRKGAEAQTAIDQAARDFDAALLPVIVRPAPAALARSASDEAAVVVATAALSSACRDMAANLALLMSHAEAACHSLGSIGDTADALVRTGADLRHVADRFKQDHERVSSELSSAGFTLGTP
jgi:hypothetical protein